MNAKLGGLPQAVATKNTVTVVALSDQLITYKDGKQASQFPIEDNFKATALDLSPKGDELAVGGSDNKVRFFEVAIDGSLQLVHKKTLTQGGAISCIQYCAVNTLLAVGDANRQIIVYDTSSLAEGEAYTQKLSQWCFHNARVSCFRWSPNGKHGASGSVDTNLEIWSVDKPMKHITIKNAHPEYINGVEWLDDSTIISVGQDACVKTWKIQHH